MLINLQFQMLTKLKVLDININVILFYFLIPENIKDYILF